MSDRLIPPSSDRSSAIALVRAAVRAASRPGDDWTEYLPEIEAKIAQDRAVGALLERDGRSIGLALWGAPGPLGLAVNVIHLVPEAASVEGYRRFFEEIARTYAPVAMLRMTPRGIASDHPREAMRELGFAPFSRSEMSFPETAPIPTAPVPVGARVRPIRPEDEPSLVRVHRVAYEGRFDRYLFLQDLDPMRDAEIGLRDLRAGRWGEFLGDASMVVESDGRVLGFTIVVRSAEGALIADVATDPAEAGRGVASAAIAATVRALRARNERWIRLAVTEENRRAARLYQRLGFVRTAGPTEDWYSVARIPVAPRED